MFSGLFAGIGLELRYMMRRSAFAAGGAVFILIGIGFLSVAGWIVLADMRDPVFASLVFGAVFFGIGLIFLGLSRRSFRASDMKAAAQAGAVAKSHEVRAAVPSMAQAFMVGLNSGLQRRG